MFGRKFYLGANYDGAPCPICGGIFSKCGLPNHLRRHKKMAIEKSDKDAINRRSAAWWDGWKEGYKLGVRDGGNQVRKKIAGQIEARY